MSNEVEHCTGCGTERKLCGPPINDLYCPNDDCDYDRQQMLRSMRPENRKDRPTREAIAAKDLNKEWVAALEEEQKIGYRRQAMEWAVRLVECDNFSGPRFDGLNIELDGVADDLYDWLTTGKKGTRTPSRDF